MNNFICPHCKEPLKLQNRTLACANKHTFDLAKEGYVNLLPVNSKKSKDPGDNMKMMTARREFLNSGHYKPLADKLNGIIQELTMGGTAKVLDLGCGEGYYTGQIKQHNKAVEMIGLDISKTAVKYASRKYKKIDFCVASAFEIPVDDEQIDIIVKIYAPSTDSELSRIVKKGGFLVTVTPGERHLYQLRELIYRKVNNHGEEIASIKNFIHEKKIKLAYTLKLDRGETVNNLLTMTPFGWKIKKEKEIKLYNRDFWEIDCDFNINIFRKL